MYVASWLQTLLFFVQVDSVHLLTACVMSAPASLVVSRMLFPEKEKSKFLTTDSLILSSG